MLHTVLIALHATAGVGCFAAGLLCIPLQAPGSWRFRVYAGSLLAMLAFVAGSIAVGWADLDMTTRLIFTGLLGLGLSLVRGCDRGPRPSNMVRQQDRGLGPSFGYSPPEEELSAADGPPHRNMSRSAGH